MTKPETGNDQYRSYGLCAGLSDRLVRHDYATALKSAEGQRVPGTLSAINETLATKRFHGGVRHNGRVWLVYEGGDVMDVGSGTPLVIRAQEAAPYLRAVEASLSEPKAALTTLASLAGTERDHASDHFQSEYAGIPEWLSAPTLADEGRLDERKLRARERKARVMAESDRNPI
jgi:hypothetical protein